MPRLSMLISAALAALLLWAGWAPSAVATHISCGDVVTSDATLDSDLTGCPGNGIVIGANHVTLDLAGHTISGSGELAGVDNSAGHHRVTVKDGRIAGFERGVMLDGASANRLLGLHLEGGRYGAVLWSSDHSLVQGTTATENSTGLYLPFASHNHVRDNTLAGNDSIGIQLVLADHNRVERNTGYGKKNRGIVLSSSADNVIRANVESDDHTSGIGLFHSDRNRVVDNTVTATRQNGFEVVNSNGNRITGNSAVGNVYGIRVYSDRIPCDDNVVRGNRTSFNSSGITIERANRTIVERNHSSDDRSYGISVFGEDGRFSQNTVLGNTGVGMVVRGPRHWVGDNTLLRNMIGALFEDAPGAQVRRNVASHNAQDGIWVNGQSPGLLLRRNHANGNGDFGIEALVPVIDGGGNRASGNGNPLQCLNVACK